MGHWAQVRARCGPFTQAPALRNVAPTRTVTHMAPSRRRLSSYLCPESVGLVAIAAVFFGMGQKLDLDKQGTVGACKHGGIHTGTALVCRVERSLGNRQTGALTTTCVTRLYVRSQRTCWLAS